MISFMEHEKNANHFYGIGLAAYAIFEQHNAISPWHRQSYFLKDISAGDKGDTVNFSFECFDQGGTDTITIVLSTMLVDNFDEGSCVAAAVRQRQANEAEAAAKKAAEVEAKEAKERTQLAQTFITQAERMNATNPDKPTTALTLAAAMGDEKLNARIVELTDGVTRMAAGTKIA